MSDPGGARRAVVRPAALVVRGDSDGERGKAEPAKGSRFGGVTAPLARTATPPEHEP